MGKTAEETMKSLSFRREYSCRPILGVAIRRLHSRYGQVGWAARTQVNCAFPTPIQLPANIVVFLTAKPIAFANLRLQPLLGDGIGQQFVIMRYGVRPVRLPEKFPVLGFIPDSAYLTDSREVTR